MAHITGKKLFTLIFVVDEPHHKILLGMKKRGFGVNKFNGFGGKLEQGETVEQGAYRELWEESSLEAKDMKKVGLNLFTFENDPTALEVHVYIVTTYDGTPKESEEMRPQWFDYKEIPYDIMWADDSQWLPLVLDNKNIIGEFHFSEDQKSILFQSLQTVDTVPVDFDLSQRKLNF
ncbi:NUDIX hydrolase domain-like protein [Spinellus fusiger]|nr:NUDIX hydrolase domain-like protein [Spinellus fusiger]KAI7868076.1 NUDIX hydrolase domain-like protein [Spinellus fusiger]